VLVLDTDHLVEFDRGSDAGEILRQRLENADDEIATTIISAEESMDLKIAAIVLSHRATLLSRNMVDFAQVPGLGVEDWTLPES